jgi:competence protein ComEC
VAPAFFRHLQFKDAFSCFWKRNPALFFGLALLFGTAAAFHPHWLFGLLLAMLCISVMQKRWILAAVLCFSGAYLTSSLRNVKITLPENAIAGTGIFHVEQVKVHASPFHRSILYTGTLKRFESDRDGQTYHDLPCHIFLPLFGDRPSADTDYEITGRLSQKADHAFQLKPDKKSLWNPIPSLPNLSEWRFQAKQQLSKYLKKQIDDPAVRTFLTALSTGDVDERILKMEFGKVGLQHILAISGFHFALAALFLNFLFRLFLPFRASAAMLIASLTLYYLFLGSAPSIQRAYIAISLVVLGQLLSMRTSGLNALGAGLIVELLLNPLVVTQLSFQLTFLCTLAILLFYPAVHRVIALLLPERTYSQVTSMNLLDQHGYILSAFLRKALALNIAVHLISLPVLLHLFHKFPLLSIAYNLFFPVCVSISMLLLFIALFFAFLLPPLSHLIHQLNNTWTSSIMALTSNPPAYLDFSIRANSVSFSFVVCFLVMSFFFGIIYYEKDRAEKKALLFY